MRGMVLSYFCMEIRAAVPCWVMVGCPPLCVGRSRLSGSQLPLLAQMVGQSSGYDELVAHQSGEQTQASCHLPVRLDAQQGTCRNTSLPHSHTRRRRQSWC